MVNEEEILNKALRYIEKYLSDEKLSVSSTADYINVRCCVLYDIFCRKQGVCPKVHIILLRVESLEKAIISDFKQNCQIKASSIAKQCGFSSMPHMNNCIKARLGISFTVFKEKVLQNAISGKPPMYTYDTLRTYVQTNL